jgi:hypothetical protein
VFWLKKTVFDALDISYWLSVLLNAGGNIDQNTLDPTDGKKYVR